MSDRDDRIREQNSAVQPSLVAYRVHVPTHERGLLFKVF